MPPNLGDNFKKTMDAMLALLEGVPTRKEFAQLAEQVLNAVKAAREAVDERLSQLRDGVDGKDGKDGAPGPRGPKGDKGDRGPIGRTFIALRGEQGPPGKDGSPDTALQVRDKLETLEADERLSKDAVKGIEELEGRVASIELRPASVAGAKGIGLYIGGLKKVLTAQSINLIGGTNVSLTYNFANGRNDITINASGSGGGGSSTILPATGTVDDSNTIFTFSSTPTLVIVNGAAYRDGHGCSIVTTTVTLDNAIGTGGDIYGLS